MNLNNLKPAWRQFLLSNSLQRIDREEILLMLESAEGLAVNKSNRLLVHTIMFIVLTFCFQGG